MVIVEEWVGRAAVTAVTAPVAATAAAVTALVAVAAAVALALVADLLPSDKELAHSQLLLRLAQTRIRSIRCSKSICVRTLSLSRDRPDGRFFFSE